MRKRKYYRPGDVIEISTRITSGLPLVPNEFINLIIEGYLARACAQFDISLNHYLFMANHLHIIFTVKDPDHVQKFVRLIKGRLSHAINKLLGRTKGVVWDEGFDDPKILDIDMLVTRLVYIYLNPAQANLVDSIEQYPGVNSWKYFKE